MVATAAADSGSAIENTDSDAADLDGAGTVVGVVAFFTVEWSAEPLSLGFELAMEPDDDPWWWPSWASTAVEAETATRARSARRRAMVGGGW
jgi:hypothetical protein